MNFLVDDVPGRPAIAIIGFSVRAAVQCANRQGFDVIAVDFCADRDLIGECQTHFRLDDPNWPEALNSMHPGVPLLFAGGMEHRVQMVDRCHRLARRCGPTGDQLAAMRSINNWAKWAGCCEIGWPLTFLEMHEFSRRSEQLAQGEWLLKPFQSAGGVGTIDLPRQDSKDEFQSAIRLKDQNRVYIQQRLPGRTLGVTFLSSEFGSTLVAAAAAWAPDSDRHETKYRYRGSVGPVPLSNDQIDKLQRFAGSVGRESGLLGLWQADFLEHDGELSLLEINPRWSASMDILDVVLDLHLVEMHHASNCATLGKTKYEQYVSDNCKRAKESNELMLGKRVVYSCIPFTVSQAQSDQWWSDRWSCDLSSAFYRSQFADIPCAGTTLSPGDPILTIMTAGSSIESIQDELQKCEV